MSALELKFLGELEILRDGEKLVLPPSKKTRALLGYLALTGRPARRDHLCELLWELPDDPRGSLRWSLSKLRRLVDDAEHTRILADRNQVSFDASTASVDVLDLLALVESGLERLSTDDLEAAVVRYDGNLLEGLDLTQLHAFYAWCVSERDRVVNAQARLLEGLIDRLADEPERALPHARNFVVRAPYDEARRADLIRLLLRSGRDDEAEQQFQMGRRLLKEVGAKSRGLLAEARYETPSTAPGSLRTVESSPPAVSIAHTKRLLVGRDAEVDRLRRGFQKCVETGQARLFLIQGEPGIGKSRLLQVGAEFAREADAYLLEATAFETETIRPFALWSDALRQRGPEDATEELLRARRDDRDQLFGNLTRHVERRSEERPVVLVFDDLQWCDESSAAALQYVAHMNRDRRVFGILAAREAELTDNTAAQRALSGLRRQRLLEDLRLGPLSDESISQIIAEYAVETGSRIKSSDCSGNPLLAIELARSPQDMDEAGSLYELVRERVSRLGLDGADVLRWAALLSPRIDVPALVRLTGLETDRVGEILESAERMAIVVPVDRGFRFSHDLVARSLYRDIAPARRKVMHGRVAENLEGDAIVDLDLAADLAHHASLSGDPALAARAMVFAGRLCLRFFANEDALSIASRGLKWVEELPDVERVPLTIDLRDIALAAAPVEDWESAAREYVELAEQALDYGALSHARLGYHMASYLRWMHGQWTHAREETLQAERAARGGTEDDHVIGLAETAKCLAMLERDLSQADAMVMEAEALAKRRDVHHHAIPAARGILHFYRNELAEAEEAFLEARTLCKSAGDRVGEFQANEYLVMIDFERGRLESASERCESLIEIGGKIREGSEAPFARALQGLCRYAFDRDDADLTAAIDELRMVDAKHRLAYSLTRAALLDIEQGRVESAIERAEEALECAVALERRTDMLLANVALAQAHEAAGETEAAARHREAIARIDVTEMAGWASDQIRASASAEDPGTSSRGRKGRTIR